MKTYIIVQWLSQDFKGDLDIDYIWVFISISLNRGIGGPKKSNWSFQMLGKVFMIVEHAASVASSKNIQKIKTLS